MNRQIKFRAYSEELKSFVYGFYQEVDVDGVGYSYIFWQGNTTPVRADSVAQFTGMYDKNGKEIYEGDILKASNSIIKIVFKGRGYEGIYLNKEEMNELPIQNNNYLYWQIIGNIYENPEFTQSSE